MKRIFLLIFVFLLIFNFYGCSHNGTENSENISDNSTYSEKTELSNGAYIIKEYLNGNLAEETVYTADNVIESFIEYTEYSDDGVNLKKISHYPNGNYSTFFYDKNGNTIKTEHYNENGSITMSAEWEYDADGRNTTFSKYDENGILVLYEEFDINGNRTKEDNYNDDGSLSCEFTFEYNEIGKIIKKTDYYAENNILKYYIYEYNQDNKLVKRYYYNEDGTLDRIREYDPETGIHNDIFFD